MSFFPSQGPMLFFFSSAKFQRIFPVLGCWILSLSFSIGSSFLQGMDQKALELKNFDLYARGVDPKEILQGKAQNPFALIEYVDLRCHDSAAFQPIVQKLLKDFPEQLSWSIRIAPLEKFDPQSTEAAKAAVCLAKLEGVPAYSQFIDYIFSNQKHYFREVRSSEDYFNPTSLQQRSLQRALECAQSSETAAILKENRNEAGTLQNRSDSYTVPFSVVLHQPSRKALVLIGDWSYEAFHTKIHEWIDSFASKASSQD